MGPVSRPGPPVRSPWVPPHVPPSAGTPTAPHLQLRDPADLGLAFPGLLTCGHRKPITVTADHLWIRGLRNLCQSPQILNSRGPPPSNQGLMRPTFCCVNILSSQETVSTWRQTKACLPSPQQGLGGAGGRQSHDRLTRTGDGWEKAQQLRQNSSWIRQREVSEA